MLAATAREHPELLQLVFRPGTILGARTRNQITELFDGRFVLGLARLASRRSSSSGTRTWSARSRRASARAAPASSTSPATARSRCARSRKCLGKPYLDVPPALVAAALCASRSRSASSRYGPEQVRFLSYRPVLANRRLKEEFGYRPRKTTREVFDLFLAARRGGA